MDLTTSVGLFKYGWTGVIIIMIVAVSVGLDLLSRYIRSRLE